MQTTTATHTAPATLTEPALMSTRAVGRYCAVSVSTVHRWQKRGWLPFVRLGATVRFERDAVEQFVARGRCTEVI
jgi:excisionase family DNA binding protein